MFWSWTLVLVRLLRYSRVFEQLKKAWIKGG